MTLYYTNQQSARLMFYHDHAFGITRLNVYAGMAARYLIADPFEQALIDGGLIPGPDPAGGPGQDVRPERRPAAQEDETWDTDRWGGEGSLWAPHVYSPAQNPGDASGVNQYGRWAYGPGSGRRRPASTTVPSPTRTSTRPCDPRRPPGASRR